VPKKEGPFTRDDAEDCAHSHTKNKQDGISVNRFWKLRIHSLKQGKKGFSKGKTVATF
jgi:hypothetical protein